MGPGFGEMFELMPVGRGLSERNGSGLPSVDLGGRARIVDQPVEAAGPYAVFENNISSSSSSGLGHISASVRFQLPDVLGPS